MTGTRFLAASVTACLLAVWPVSASAQDPHPAPPSPLKPGHSAGVHAAQQTRTGLALIGTGTVIAVVIVAATASGNGGGNNNQVNPQFAPTTTAP